jgi:prevent-host-death family protein
MVIIHSYYLSGEKMSINTNRIVTVTDFKAHCLEYIENTNNDYKEYILTKRNKPVAKLVPFKEEGFRFGQFKDTALIKGNVLESIDIDWEVSV